MHALLREPIGVELTDLTLTDVNADAITRLGELLADHGTAIVPAQALDDASFLTFLRSFGELMFTEGETPVVDFPDLSVVSNVGRSTPPQSVFHVDTSYVRHPPAYTALRAVQIPERGGQTLFTNQYRAYESLPHEIRSELDGRMMTHRIMAGDDAHTEIRAEHPVFREHPISGRTSLYVSTPQRCISISGMDDAEAAAMIGFLYAHSTEAANMYRHTWAPGDVVVWDNGCVMHCADHRNVVGDRVMHRGLVAAYPVPSVPLGRNGLGETTRC